MDAVVGGVDRWGSRRVVALAFMTAVAWSPGVSAQRTPDPGAASPAAGADLPGQAPAGPDAAADGSPAEPESEEADGASGTSAPGANSGTPATGSGPTATRTPRASATMATSAAGATTSRATPSRRAAEPGASRAPRRGDQTSDEARGEDEAEEDRLRFAYLEVSGGMSWINLAVINQDNFVPEFETMKGTGFAVGAGAGFFLSFVTLGVQAEYANHDGFDVGVVALDLGIRIPTPHIEPYLRVGVGYAWLFNLDRPIWAEVGSIRGVCADIGFGFDFMITPLIAIGVGVDTALFNVRRSGTRGAPMVGSVVLEESGDAVGVQVSALLQLNLHF